MTDIRVELPRFSEADLPDHMSQSDIEANRYTQDALERHKREGLELAVRARWIALAVVAVMLPFLNPDWSMLYYEAMLGLVAAIGWLQRRFGRVGRSNAELNVLALDLFVMVFVLTFPNPFSPDQWPSAMTYQFGGFLYMFVILATGTLCYSWRTIMALGTWTSGLWLIAAVLIYWFGRTVPELDAAAQSAFGHDPGIMQVMNPNSVNFDFRIQEIVVFLIVTGILAISVRRFNRLLLGNAALERERTNLSRYFSPNVVEELSQNDEPLKQVRSHNVGVLFVDIVGFTRFAAEREPEDVIATLRDFQGRMETCVFDNDGTLDKFLGDGLMATFGTPVPMPDDATRAIRCALEMRACVRTWNEERVAKGEPALRAGFGVHYGPVVLADIGSTRLEYAVIGNTVNVASRLEALTRTLDAHIVVSDDALAASGLEPETHGFERAPEQSIRGTDDRISVWLAA
jgi:adenylate cyclase